MDNRAASVINNRQCELFGNTKHIIPDPKRQPSMLTRARVYFKRKQNASKIAQVIK